MRIARRTQSGHKIAPSCVPDGFAKISVSSLFLRLGGSEGTRTRDLLSDRQAFWFLRGLPS